MELLATSCYLPEAMARVPLRPTYGSSTAQPASKAAGTPMTLRMTCCTAASVMKHETEYYTCIAIGNVQRSIPEDSTAARKSTSNEIDRRYTSRLKTHKYGRKLLYSVEASPIMPVFPLSLYAQQWLHPYPR